MTGQPHDSAVFLAWLRGSCARQNVPVIVADPATISQIAVLLGVTLVADTARRPAAAPPAANSRTDPLADAA